MHERMGEVFIEKDRIMRNMNEAESDIRRTDCLGFCQLT